MSRVNRLAPRAILMASLVTMTLATALADHATDDAGTGVDAGNTKETATVVPYGAHHGYLSPRDVDWYRAASASTGPRCVEARATGENNDTVRLTIDSLTRTRSVTGSFPAGGSKSLALAVPDVQGAYFDIAASPNSPNSGDPARPGHYDFTFSAMRVPSPSAGDALTGADAGGSLERATPAPGACFGGTIAPLSGMGDMRDVYSVKAVAGEAITYGFAVSGDPGALTLTLLDASGKAIGPALASGQYASVQVPTSGTYYLAASQGSVGADDIGYLVSVMIGPPEPGSACRPQC